MSCGRSKGRRLTGGASSQRRRRHYRVPRVSAPGRHCRRVSSPGRRRSCRPVGEPCDRVARGHPHPLGEGGGYDMGCWGWGGVFVCLCRGIAVVWATAGVERRVGGTRVLYHCLARRWLGLFAAFYDASIYGHLCCRAHPPARSLARPRGSDRYLTRVRLYVRRNDTPSAVGSGKVFASRRILRNFCACVVA